MAVSEPTPPRRITAYRIPGYNRYPEIVPAAADREWMDQDTKGWANRCLPLRIANQAGWFLLNDAGFEVMWAGKPDLDSIKIVFDKGEHSELVSSMFGFGIFTFIVPYLFRTPAAMNVHAAGPANLFKDGAAPLSGIIEADWAPYPFTMNWRLTRKLKWVRFERGEPICMLMPIPRGHAENFQAEIRNLETDGDLLAKYEAWHKNRVKNVEATAEGAPLGGELKHSHYTRGEDQEGQKAREHQVRLAVAPFRDIDPPPEVPTAEPAAEESKGGLLGRLFRKS